MSSTLKKNNLYSASLIMSDSKKRNYISSESDISINLDSSNCSSPLPKTGKKTFKIPNKEKN